jgi:hypothetical protein
VKVWVVLVRGMAFLAGCGSNETNDNEKRGPANEETRFVAQIVTVEETTVVTKAPSVSQEQPPEDVLALQYEYINSSDFEEAYLLLAEQSRREVSLEQCRACFEDNSGSVEAAFTVTSASGVERLERTQEFVREGGDRRVVMRPEQVAVFTATQDEEEVDAEPDEPAVECRAFTQSEFVNATPEQKAFIRECDQAIIRSQQDSTSKG